jgi:hypothetical protein
MPPGPMLLKFRHSRARPLAALEFQPRPFTCLPRTPLCNTHRRPQPLSLHTLTSQSAVYPGGTLRPLRPRPCAGCSGPSRHYPLCFHIFCSPLPVSPLQSHLFKKGEGWGSCPRPFTSVHRPFRPPRACLRKLPERSPDKPRSLNLPLFFSLPIALLPHHRATLSLTFLRSLHAK